MNRTLKIIFLGMMIVVVIMTLVLVGVTFFSDQRKGKNLTPDSRIRETSLNQGVEDRKRDVTPQSRNVNGTVRGLEENGNSGPTLEENLKITARNFAERFGSFSNQSNYENVMKLFPYMSESMRRWAEQYVVQEKAKVLPHAEYYGMTTKALSVSMVVLDEKKGRAELIISTQRREVSQASSAPKVFYQDLSMTFVQEDSVWFVNEARWK